MNRFAKMLLTDGRNPYGSRGGYVRDRGYDYNEDYARGGRGRDRGYEDMARSRRDRNDYNDYGYDYGYDMARGGRRDRADYGEDYARGGRGGGRDRDYEEDYASYNDYGEPKLFKKKDIETWKAMMKNEDGTRGEHFRPEQVKHASQQAGIDIEEFGEDIFGLAMNMKYSDTCKVAKKYGVDRPEYYADLAKSFLKDKDFDGKPEEKLYLYYKTIVEKDD